MSDGTLFHFDGDTYKPSLDCVRLNAQLSRVFSTMRDRVWRTLAEIQTAIRYAHGVEDPQASISARLRDLRKAKFGAHDLCRRRRGEGKRGLFEYRLIENDQCELTLVLAEVTA